MSLPSRAVSCRITACIILPALHFSARNPCPHAYLFTTAWHCCLLADLSQLLCSCWLTCLCLLCSSLHACSCPLLACNSPCHLQPHFHCLELLRVANLHPPSLQSRACVQLPACPCTCCLLTCWSHPRARPSYSSYQTPQAYTASKHAALQPQPQPLLLPRLLLGRHQVQLQPMRQQQQPPAAA
jgi:hypothetical protein